MTQTGKMGRGRILFKEEDFHPRLRDGLVRELSRLQESFPPLGQDVEVKVGGLDSEGQALMLKGYGVTSTLGWQVDWVSLNPGLYGVEGDLKGLEERLQSDLEKDFHGSMADPCFPLTHEWGHAVYAFAGKKMEGGGRRILKACSAISDYFEAKDGSRVLLPLLSGGEPPEELISYYGTGYALESFSEFFAETFALLRWGNDREKGSEACRLMMAVLDALYSNGGNQ